MTVRVVMFVLNPVRYDRRVFREASGLADAGFAVTVAGTADPGTTQVTRERHADGFHIIRVPLPGGLSSFRTPPPGGSGRPLVSGLVDSKARLRLPGAAHARWLVNARRRWWAWGRAAATAAGPADVFHGHDFTGLGVALHARRLFGGRLVYDSHDLFLEAGTNAARPRLIRQLIRTVEGRWYRNADLVVTVNRGLADRLIRAYGEKPVAVVHNCVPRSLSARPSEDVLRVRTGIPSGSPVVLYHGGFTANRGLGILMRAMLQPGLERAHLVLLGYGPMHDELERLARTDRFAGRVHVVPAVPPDELDQYVACADVSAMVNQPSSDNEVLSTPNKLFESLGAGVPVVTSDFPMRREIVLGDPYGPLGAVCDPTDVNSIGEALRQILNAPDVLRRSMRERCLRAAHERWNWERECGTLIAAYRDMLRASNVVARVPARDELA